MKNIGLVIVFFVLLLGLSACEKNTMETDTHLSDLEKTAYFDAEVFAEPYLKIYGKWELFGVSGGFAGNGHDLNFEYLEMKKFGIYSFWSNESLLEYGKVSPALQTANEPDLKIEFEKDDDSASFFTDNEKYVVFEGNDTLHLNSPCCDRYNYHFKRVK